MICGAALQLYLDGKKVADAYSPFTAEIYSPGQSPEVSSPNGNPKDGTK
jgi:hypothetical protein